MGAMEGQQKRNPIVMHTLAKSFPPLNGYTVRSHELLLAQNNSDRVTSFALTSPYYSGIYESDDDVNIDGVEYLRTPIHRSVKGKAESKLRTNGIEKTRIRGILGTIYSPIRLFLSLYRESVLMKKYQRRIELVIRERDPCIVHAHTPFKVGIPSMKAARKFGKPFVYEARGVWEESAIARGNFSRWSPRYWRFRLMEKRTMKNADLVYCISKELRAELISRGVDRNKIFVIKNGAPSRYLEDLESAEYTGENNSEIEIFEELGKRGGIIGYTGSIQRYEGLELLSGAIKNVVENGVDLSLLIISNEEDVTRLRRYCEDLGMGDYTHIIGPVPRSEIRKYFELMDVFVVPRLNESKMSELVTPMKQMEPLALGIPLLISDIPAIRGIIGNDTATFFEPGNMEDLSEKISMLISGDGRIKMKAENGIEWIRNEGTWDISAEKSIDLYRHLIDLGNK